MFGFWIFWILLIILILAIPVWPYSRPWGYGPVGGIGCLWIIILFLIWWGWIAWAWPWY